MRWRDKWRSCDGILQVLKVEIYCTCQAGLCLLGWRLIACSFECEAIMERANLVELIESCYRDMFTCNATETYVSIELRHVNLTMQLNLIL